MAISIREFDFPKDYNAVFSLWKKAGSGIHIGRSDSPDEIRKKMNHDPDLFLIAEKDGEMVGSVIGGFDGRRGLVYHLAVTTKARRKGIGRQLMDELENRLKSKGCIRCYLLVTKENWQAVQFYEKHGWVKMDGLYVFGKDI